MLKNVSEFVIVYDVEVIYHKVTSNSEDWQL